jgi:hypothetical protein
LLGIGIFKTYKGDVPRMTRDELKAMLVNPYLVVIDVRLAKDWNQSDSKLRALFEKTLLV